MTILFLTPRIPYPPYRGDKLKIWNLLRQLSAHHQIILLSFIQSRKENEYLQLLREVCQEVHLVYLPRWKSVLNCLLAIFKRIPFQVAYYRSQQMRRVLEDILARVKPDLIHTHLIRMAQYTAHRTSLPRVLDLTDAMSLYLSRLSKTHPNPMFRRTVGIELRRMIKYESVIAKFDRAMVCSELDKNFLLKRVPSATIDLLYNGIDLETFSVNGAIQYDPNRIIFTGNMSYFPNIDGAKFIAQEIFPLIQEKIPTAKLYIVGQDPPRSVRALMSKHIIVTGFVNDIRQEYLKSSVAVSPIRFGAGTLNKILEPLALGVPVVSTSVGVEGLGLNVGEEIFVTDEPREFAQNVVRLLSDTALRNRVTDAVAEKVRTRFSWDRIGDDLEQIYEDVLLKWKT